MTWLSSSIFVKKRELILEYHVCEKLSYVPWAVLSYVPWAVFTLDKFALIYIGLLHPIGKG